MRLFVNSSQQSEIHHTFHLRDNKRRRAALQYVTTYRSGWILVNEKQTEGCAEIREEWETGRELETRVEGGGRWRRGRITGIRGLDE